MVWSAAIWIGATLSIPVDRFKKGKYAVVPCPLGQGFFVKKLLFQTVRVTLKQRMGRGEKREVSGLLREFFRGAVPALRHAHQRVTAAVVLR